MTIKQQIRTFISENLLYSSNGLELSDDTSFLDKGVVDSTGVLELVLFVEETFGVSVDDDEIVPDNFDSLNNLTAYVQHKTGKSAL